ncbi:MAG: polyhydroxyalkanoate synthesis regulator DNA-binding domain-containing protein [Candidatus Promineifilaceae bacterium]
MTVIVKRYPNRKLYNTQTKKYVTLDAIADVIRAGNEVQILDHSTGEDLTTLTLSQIIFEQEKKKSGFLPKSVLTNLIQAGGETLGSLRRSLTNPLEILTPVEQEIDRRLQELVHHGEMARDEMLRVRRQLFNFSILDLRGVQMEEEEEIVVEEKVTVVEDSAESKPNEIDLLRAQLNILTQQVNALSDKQAKDTAA